MRPKHVVGGLIIFGIGLFMTYANILYVIEFIKGGLQPLFILIGVVAAAAAVFRGSTLSRKINVVVAIIFLFLGGYGFYDEYYATMDFLNGIFPPALIIAGLASLSSGISRLK